MFENFLLKMQSLFPTDLVYVIIIIVVVLGFTKCIIPVLYNASLLKSAVRKLEKQINKGGRPAWQEPRFLGRSLQLHWQKFLLNAQHLDIRGIPCNTTDYINEDTVIYVPGHAQFGELIPTLLTSLGILGTFIGLMQGLAGLDISTAEKTMESIPILLEGMKYAFNTSIVGIAFSLIFNMTNRISIGHAYKAIDAFDEAFYELAMPRPLDPTVQLICQNQDSTAIIKTASDEITGKLVNSIEIAVGRSLQPVAMSMDNFIAGTTHEQIEGIQKIVNQFVVQMNQNLNGQFKVLAENLNKINKNQAISYENMQQNIEATNIISENLSRIQSATTSITKSVDEYLINQKSAIGATDESFKTEIKNTLAIINKNLEQQKEFKSNLESYRDLLQKDYQEYIKNIDKLVLALNKDKENNTKEISNMAQEMEASMKSITRKYTDAANDISADFNITMDNLNKGLNSLIDIIAKKTKEEEII
ncbi:MAG: hypothetical protein GYA87_09810 [Christensenellaceae bacterium]|nr:hypothetical protein [Christensenellaceae bacterium]